MERQGGAIRRDSEEKQGGRWGTVLKNQVELKPWQTVGNNKQKMS